MTYSYKNAILDIEKTLHDTDTGGTSGSGLFYTPYTWNRILKSSDFVEELKKETHVFTIKNKDVSESQFVFRFLETERNETNSSMGQSLRTEMGMRVFNVGLLRLKFLSGNRVYNLGVVSDLVTDDGIPDFSVTAADNILNNLEELTKKLGVWFEKLILIVGIILIVAFLNPIIKILEFIFNSVLGIVRIITKPIRNLLKRRRN